MRFFNRSPDPQQASNNISPEANRRTSTDSVSARDIAQTNDRARWSLGILSDPQTDEVPGSVLLLSDVSNRNAPLGMQHAPRRQSASSLPSPYPPEAQSGTDLRGQGDSAQEKKRTADGKIILDPQPEDSANDPLNWPSLRRDAALLSVGLYCMIGGGMTPILAAGFSNVADTYHVSEPRVALTTGLYMMGLGLGSVIWSPTAIQFGKRPIYLATTIIFILSAVWCALSPSYASLVVARIFQGFAVAPVECLPSATIAEIFFLHERAYRLGIYTLLLLGGKNLVPLVSAVIIGSKGWRWVFWVVAMVVGFCGVLLFFFVPETFWDRTPRPTAKINRPRPSPLSLRRLSSYATHRRHSEHDTGGAKQTESGLESIEDLQTSDTRPNHNPESRGVARHAHFAEDDSSESDHHRTDAVDFGISNTVAERPSQPTTASPISLSQPVTPHTRMDEIDSEKQPTVHAQSSSPISPYTAHYRLAPPKSFSHTLRPYSGRLSSEPWLRIAARPFILFAYPAILWSAAVYSLSIGWLIVLSESVTTIYRTPAYTYNFTPIQAGLIYISPFIGGILGTAVAGKVSDFLVLYLSRRNGGIYEPEFRLFMAIPVAITTVIGLMGYGWSAQVHDTFWVPTVFFGILSFGCSLGSTTAITFAVDSYRQYAGEALVTLNFSKNIFHGLVFSLFFNDWLASDGSKTVFLCLGGIQLAFLLATVPMYVFGKRARMWTARTQLMRVVGD